MSHKFPLNNPKSVRNSVSRLIREYYRNEEGLEPTVTWWNGLGRLFDTLVKAHRLEIDSRVEDRLAKLEEFVYGQRQD